LLEIALDLAHKAYDKGEVPVGAVISCRSSIISSSHNLVETLNDPTAHAEILAIRAACEMLGSRYLDECEIYVTLEPCAMCAQAISLARIKKLYFGAYDVKSGGVDNGARVFASSSCHHKPEVIGGIREAECAELMSSFFQHRR